MSHFIIVGQRLSSLGDYLLTHGHEYTFLHDIKKTKFPDKKFKRRIVTDFSSTETIESALGQIKSPVDGVLSTYEDYILPAAWIADHLGLPGMPVSAAEACTDKALMRKLFGAAPEKISPAYATVTTEDEVRDFASSHSFPLILACSLRRTIHLMNSSLTIENLSSSWEQPTKSLLRTVRQSYLSKSIWTDRYIQSMRSSTRKDNHTFSIKLSTIKPDTISDIKTTFTIVAYCRVNSPTKNRSSFVTVPNLA